MLLFSLNLQEAGIEPEPEEPPAPAVVPSGNYGYAPRLLSGPIGRFKHTEPKPASTAMAEAFAAAQSKKAQAKARGKDQAAQRSADIAKTMERLGIVAQTLQAQAITARQELERSLMEALQQEQDDEQAIATVVALLL